MFGMERTHIEDFKKYLEGILKMKSGLHLKEEYRIGDFRADFVIIDSDEIPRIVLEVKEHYSPITRGDIRTWKAECIINGSNRKIPVLFAYKDHETWHFRDDKDEPVDIRDRVLSLAVDATSTISRWPFYSIGTVFSLICIPEIIPLFLLCITTHLTMETVILLCVAGLCFLLPTLFPYIKEVHWNGVILVFTQRDNK